MDRGSGGGGGDGAILGRSTAGVISSSLANFSTSESSESLLDNRSRNLGEDSSIRDVQIQFSNDFSLLLEDFSEFFYNFNGTAGGGAAPGSSGAYGGNFSSNYDFPSNCSLVNSTCGAPIESKYMGRDERVCELRMGLKIGICFRLLGG